MSFGLTDLQWIQFVMKFSQILFDQVFFGAREEPIKAR